MALSSVESMLSGWRSGAVVAIHDRGADVMFRPAAFVYADRNSAMWVEPSYADPWGASSSAFHRREGDVQVVGDGLEVHTSNGGRITFTPYTTRDQALVGDALEWFARWLTEEGKAWSLERNQVKKLCK